MMDGVCCVEGNGVNDAGESEVLCCTWRSGGNCDIQMRWGQERPRREGWFFEKDGFGRYGIDHVHGTAWDA